MINDTEAHFRIIVDAIPTAAWTALPDGSNEFVNQRWFEYTGLRSSDTAGVGWKAAFHPDDIDEHVAKWRASLASGQPLENETRLRRASNGEYRWFLIRAEPLRDETGHVTRWYGIATDIEDRKRAEQALQRSEAYLAEAQRLSHTGSWAFDVASRRVVHASEESHRLFGFDAGADMPGWDDWIQRIHPDDRERAIATIESKIRERLDFEVACRTVHPNGTIRHVQFVGHPVLSPSGDLVKFVGTTIDVTERKRADEAQAELAHISRVATMGELTASIAHEVTQPIAATLISAEAALRWLDHQPPNVEAMQKSLAQIINNGRRAGAVVDRIRDLVKKAPPRVDVLDINAPVREVIELTRADAVRNGVAFKAALAEDLPSISGDRVQLQQVVLNLIMNAVEAMNSVGDGARELLVSTGNDSSGDVLVAVRDSGPGLTAAAEARLFEAFYTTKATGLGMGLSICRSIVEAHGGRLWASANLPRGAVFQFTLPVQEEADAARSGD